MESALYGIYELVVFVSEILLVRCAHSFNFWYVNNSCINTVRQHFPWSILYRTVIKRLVNCGLHNADMYLPIQLPTHRILLSLLVSLHPKVKVSIIKSIILAFYIIN